MSIERVDVPGGVRLEGHAHEVPHLSFLERGGVTTRHFHRARAVEAGTLRSSPAGDTIDLIFEEPSRCLIVLLHGDPCDISPRIANERRFLRSERIDLLARHLSAILSFPVPPSGLEIEALVLELSAEVFLTGETRRMRPIPPWLLRIRDRIRSNPHAPPTTSELAAEAGYHPVYVARAFRQVYGIGIGEYVRLLRAEHARRMLGTTRLPLAEIALRAGYADQSHLTRSIRRLLGSTPSALRRLRGRTVEVASIQESGSHAS